jgi:hypothetical protein
VVVDVVADRADRPTGLVLRRVVHPLILPDEVGLAVSGTHQ